MCFVVSQPRYLPHRNTKRACTPGFVLYSSAMKFFLPLLVWLVMGSIIAAGMVMAVMGKGLWLMTLGLLGFIVMVAKYGCLSQH